MTQTWDCAETRISLGVYVLGAIDRAERALVDAHLATCRDCKDEVAGLAGLPALLARVNSDEVSPIGTDEAVTADEPAPAKLVGTVLNLAPERRRRTRRRPTRWRYAAAAAAVVVIAGGLFGGLRSLASPATSPTAVAFSPGPASWDWARGVSQTTGESASVAYAAERWGTVFAAQVRGIPTGTTCQLWVVHPDGTRTGVAAWTTAGDEGHVWYWGSMPNSTRDISHFEITAGNKLLVTANLV
jgi:anti-sigma factor RsiW